MLLFYKIGETKMGDEGVFYLMKSNWKTRTVLSMSKFFIIHNTTISKIKHTFNKLVAKYFPLPDIIRDYKKDEYQKATLYIIYSIVKS
jgi:hypothetical protein